jgi:DNA-binding MarR family transcriptional regulator
MDAKDLRTLHILESAEREHPPSQRDLARELNISLGLVNSFIRRLVKKGYFKITHIPKKRIRYILTSKGAAEKSKLTYAYIQHSYHFYRQARHRIRKLLRGLESEGVRRVLLYGASDLAEITIMSMRETRIEAAAVLDHEKAGKRLLNQKIYPPSEIDQIEYDMIFITADQSRDILLESLINSGIPRDSVILL